MSKFLAEGKLEKAIAGALAGHVSSMAIAFWGTGSAEWLKNTGVKLKGSRILCDLWSGCCNPEEIRALLKLGVEVREVGDLHAKVWICDSDVIVGSANVSGNGLGFNSRKYFNLEAGFSINDHHVRKTALDWFDKIWLSEARRVTLTHLDEVQPLWDANNRSSSRLERFSLLEAFENGDRKAINAVGMVKISAYDTSDFSDGAEDIYEKSAKHTYTERSLNFYSDQYPFYEDVPNWKYSPGDIIIDFQMINKKRLHFAGIWQIRSKPHLNFGKSRLILCDPLIGVERFRLSPKDKALLRKLVLKKIDATSGQLDKAGFYVFETLGDFLKKWWK